MWKLFSRIAERLSSTSPVFARYARYLPTRPMEALQLYIRIIAISLVLAIIWACNADIDRVVRVSGHIIPAGRSREIQHLEGGIVASIQASEGAAVKKGDLLMTIDNVAAGANLAETKVKLTAQRLRAARLEAEVNQKSTMEIPDDLKQEEASSAEQKLFTSRTEKVKKEMQVLEENLRQQMARLSEAKSRYGRLAGELKIARDRSGLMQEMHTRGSASKLEFLEAQSRERKLETEMSEAQSTVPTLEAAIAETKARMTSLRADSTNTSQNELVATLAEVERLKKVLLTDSDRFQRTEIRAPEDGVINRVAVNTLGGVVKPGDKLIELIPYTNEVLIEARAQPKDRGYLRPGLPASVRLSAYDIGEFGVLESQVTEVSADVVPDGKGEAFYRVKLAVNSIPSSYMGHLMVPGMTATADIVTGKRTVMAFLLSPIRKFTYSIFRDSI